MHSLNDKKNNISELYQNLNKIITQPKYPFIKDTFDDKWIKNYTKKKTDDGLPEILYAPHFIELGLLPKEYFERFEKGLKFLCENSQGENKKDFLGNLRSGSQAAVFEVMLAWTLVEEFGANNIKPYPRINSTKNTLDFAIINDQIKVNIEATTLFDDKNTSDYKQYCRQRSIQMYPEMSNNQKDINRLYKKCHDKITQRKTAEPLVLCINQYAAWPDPASGAEAIGKLIAHAIRDQKTTLIGIAYFYHDNLILFSTVEKNIRALIDDPAIVNKICSSMRRISKKIMTEKIK